jgi:hypothetical protein
VAIAKAQAVILALIMFASRAPAQQQPPPAQPSPPQQDASLDAARIDAARGEYRAAILKIGKLLYSFKEPTPDERYELLMLKGECQLQLKDRMGSASTFKSAAKAAGDLNQLAAARANALIVERSAGGVYKSASASGESIDILAPESRKKAMAQLLQDTWSKNKRDIDAAMRGETLPPIEKVFVAVADSYALELTTTGEAKQIEPVMRELGGRAFGLIRDEVTRYTRLVEQMNQLSNSAQDYARGWGASRRGLLPDERDDLRNAIAYLTKVQDRVREYRRIAARLGGNQQKWDLLVADIADAIAEAEAVLSSAI